MGPGQGVGALVCAGRKSTTPCKRSPFCTPGPVVCRPRTHHCPSTRCHPPPLCPADGEVRHFDLREAGNRRLLACRTQRGSLELNSVHCRPGTTQFCVAGGDPFVRVYDLRRLPPSSDPIAQSVRQLAGAAECCRPALSAGLSLSGLLLTARLKAPGKHPSPCSTLPLPHPTPPKKGAPPGAMALAQPALSGHHHLCRVWPGGRGAGHIQWWVCGRVMVWRGQMGRRQPATCQHLQASSHSQHRTSLYTHRRECLPL